MSELVCNPTNAPSKMGGQGWAAVAALALGSFASVTTEMLPVGVLPDVVRTFDVSAGRGGLMMTLPGLFAAIAAPGVMLVSRRADRRHVLLVLSTLLLVASLMSAFATHFWIMLGGRALVGVSLGAYWAMALAVAARLVRPNRVHIAAAAVFGGVTTAMIVGVPFGTFVAGLTSWRGAFLAAAAIGATALIAQYIALPSIPATETLSLERLFAFVRNPIARRSMATTTLTFAAHFGTYTFLAPLLASAGLGGNAITWVLLGYGGFGFLSNAIASRFVTHTLRATLLVTILLMAVAMLVLPTVLTNPWMVLALIAVWGLAWGALPLALNMWHRRIPGSDAETMSAMFTFTTQVAIAGGTVVAGALVDARGVPVSYVAGALVAAIAALVVILLPVAAPNGA